MLTSQAKTAPIISGMIPEVRVTIPLIDTMVSMSDGLMSRIGWDFLRL